MEVFNFTAADIDGFFDEKSRMRDLFSWIEGEFASQGKLVCQFVINGKKLSEKEEMDWASESITKAQQIKVLVQGEKELVLDVLNSWIEALPEIEQFVDNHLLKNKSHSSPQFIDDMIELNEQQQSFVDSLMSLKAPLKRMSVDLRQWEVLERALHHYVMQCVKAVETKNFVQLLQTVEYDGCEVFNNWKTQLTRAKEEVQNFTSQPPRAVLDRPATRKL